MIFIIENMKIIVIIVDKINEKISLYLKTISEKWYLVEEYQETKINGIKKNISSFWNKKIQKYGNIVWNKIQKNKKNKNE